MHQLLNDEYTHICCADKQMKRIQQVSNSPLSLFLSLYCSNVLNKQHSLEFVSVAIICGL